MDSMIYEGMWVVSILFTLLLFLVVVYYAMKRMRIVADMGAFIAAVDTRGRVRFVVIGLIPVSLEKLRRINPVLYRILAHDEVRNYIQSQGKAAIKILDTQWGDGWLLKLRDAREVLSPLLFRLVKTFLGISHMIMVMHYDLPKEEDFIRLSTLSPMFTEHQDIKILFNMVREWMISEVKYQAVYKINKDTSIQAVINGNHTEIPYTDQHEELVESLKKNTHILAIPDESEIRRMVDLLNLPDKIELFWNRLYTYSDEDGLYLILLGTNDKDSAMKINHELEDKLPFLITMSWGLGHGYALNESFIFRQLIDSIPTGILFKDMNGRYLYVNKIVRDFFGASILDFSGHTVDELPVYDEQFKRIVSEDERQVVETGEHHKRTAVVKDLDGNEHVISYVQRLLRSPSGEAQGILVAVTDITELVRQSKRIKMLADVISKVDMNIFILNEKGELIYFNEIYRKRFKQAFGADLEDLQKDKVILLDYWKNFIDSTLFVPLSQAFEMAKKDGHAAIRLPYVAELLPVEKRKRVYKVDFYAIEIPVPGKEDSYETVILGTGKDITHQTRMQHALSITQKMDSVGRLAGGLAHDFNNLLTGIIGEVEYILTLSNVKPPKELEDDLQQIKNLATQASQLSRQLLELVRPSESQYGECDMVEVVRNFTDFIQHSFPSNIKVTATINGSSAYVHLPDSQVQQILMNLAVNARDAMPDGGELSIILDTKIDHPFEQDKKVHRLVVKDTGHGIPPQILDKIFEPFFTTKGRKKGTGLGLSIVYSIVTGAGGTILCDSMEGNGTAFSVYLPVHHNMVPKPRRAPSRELKAVQNVPILVVDDEQVIRKVLKRGLPKQGFEPTLFEYPSKAVEFIRSGGKATLALLDMDMPEMSGIELARKLHELDPELQVIIMTGHLQNSYSFEEEYIINVVQKPFELKILGKILRLALEGIEVGTHMISSEEASVDEE